MSNALKDGLNIPDIIASGKAVQAGEFVATAGSVGTVTFLEAYATAPIVVTTVVGGVASYAASTTTGFTVNTTVASASGTYIAFLGN